MSKTCRCVTTRNRSLSVTQLSNKNAAGTYKSVIWKVHTSLRKLITKFGEPIVKNCLHIDTLRLYRTCTDC